MNYHIQVTDKAREHIVKLLAQTPGSGLRISIKKTGCSGYSYVPSVARAPHAQDAIVEDTFPIYIDTQYGELLQTLSIDFVEDQAGLKQKKLVFSNPKEAGRCGCGESFHIDEVK